MDPGDRLFHFLVCAEEGLMYWQNVVVAAPDIEAARRNLLDYLALERSTFLQFDEEETKEIDVDSFPSGWLQNARSKVGVVGAGGRIWVKESQGTTWISRIRKVLSRS